MEPKVTPANVHLITQILSWPIDSDRRISNPLKWDETDPDYPVVYRGKSKELRWDVNGWRKDASVFSAVGWRLRLNHLPLTTS